MESLEIRAARVLPSKGVVLSPSGGEGSETIRNFNYKGIITFDEASVCVVAGSQSGRYRNTIATVSIRNLNVLNMVQAELLVARVTSEHLAADTGRHAPCGEPQFTFEGSLLKDVRIAGKPVNVSLDHSLFSRYATHSALVKAFADKASADDKALGITSRTADGDETLRPDTANDSAGLTTARAMAHPSTTTSFAVPSSATATFRRRILTKI